MLILVVSRRGHHGSCQDGVDEIPVIIVLAQERPSLYDPYASEDEDYPQAIPVRLLRGNSAEKWLNVLCSNRMYPLKTHIGFSSRPAPSQQSFYHRRKSCAFRFLLLASSSVSSIHCVLGEPRSGLPD
jgi:hypothetical protein